MADRQYRGLIDGEAAVQFECRIEALRAASRVTAAAIVSDQSGESPDGETLAEDAIAIAEQFAKWLETGER